MNDKSDYEPGAEPVSSDKKFEVMGHEADGYYRTIVSIATAMMGGSILFLEKIAPHPIGGRFVYSASAGWPC